MHIFLLYYREQSTDGYGMTYFSPSPGIMLEYLIGHVMFIFYFYCHNVIYPFILIFFHLFLKVVTGQPGI